MYWILTSMIHRLCFWKYFVWFTAKDSLMGSLGADTIFANATEIKSSQEPTYAGKYAGINLNKARNTLAKYWCYLTGHPLKTKTAMTPILSRVTVDFRCCNTWFRQIRQSWYHGNIRSSLHRRQNDHDGISNHQPHGCLLNRLFRRRSKKTSKLRVTGLCVGNSPGPGISPHKGPVTRKMFPFDDVIMSKLDTVSLVPGSWCMTIGFCCCIIWTKSPECKDRFKGILLYRILLMIDMHVL